MSQTRQEQTITVNTDVMRRWANALASGNFQQGNNVLQADGKFCCLGVLCELAKDDGLVLMAQYPSGTVWYVDASKEHERSYTAPPSVVRDWAGLDRDDINFFVALNDEYGVGFDGIAYIIREKFIERP
jgi:hypothetical protein